MILNICYADSVTETFSPLPPGTHVYFNVHDRVRRARGSAKQFSCADCDQPAHDWSWIHGLDPMSIASYEPRCRHCHSIYDELGQKSNADRKGKILGPRGPNSKPFSEEARANMSAAGRGRPKSPEHRAAISAAKKVAWSDPEIRERRAQAMRDWWARRKATEDG